MIPFDMTGNNNDTGGPIDEKSNQWFGASISSSGDDGVIVVSPHFSAHWSSLQDRMFATSNLYTTKTFYWTLLQWCFLLPLQCNYRVGDVRVIINSLEMYLINFHSYFPIFMKHTFYQLLNISKWIDPWLNPEDLLFPSSQVQCDSSHSLWHSVSWVLGYKLKLFN